MDGFPDPLLLTGPQVLGYAHIDPAAQADEKTGEEGDEDAGRAHGAQSRGAGELAHHGHIRHVEHDL